jgi:hypothetical protein
VQQWGTFDPMASSVHLHAERAPADEDLLDFAAIHTLANGGTVHAMKQEEVPDKALLAALYRY